MLVKGLVRDALLVLATGLPDTKRMFELISLLSDDTCHEGAGVNAGSYLPAAAEAGCLPEVASGQLSSRA